MKSRAELYLDHLYGLIGVEPRFNLFGPEGGPLLASRASSIPTSPRTDC